MSYDNILIYTYYGALSRYPQRNFLQQMGAGTENHIRQIEIGGPLSVPTLEIKEPIGRARGKISGIGTRE